MICRDLLVSIASYDFDLATENNLNLNSKVVSDEIVFSNRILTDYFESDWKQSSVY